jgi:hypothetical protein
MPEDREGELSPAEHLEAKRRARKLRRARGSAAAAAAGWGGLALAVVGTVWGAVAVLLVRPFSWDEAAMAAFPPALMAIVGLGLLMFGTPTISPKRRGEYKGKFSHLAEMDEPGQISTKWTWRPWRWLRKGD